LDPLDYGLPPRGSQNERKGIRRHGSLGKAAAGQAATAIRRVVQDLGRARIIAATGASQFEFLDALTREPEIDWQRVEVFHLDEYIGLPSPTLPAFENIFWNG